MGTSRRRPDPRKLKKLTLDTGALIAFDRGDRRMRALLEDLRSQGGRVVVPTCALAEVWRDGASQAELAKLVNSDFAIIEDLDGPRAKAVGELCGLRDSSDIVDAFVVLTAMRYGRMVVTGDADDLSHIDRGLEIVPVSGPR